MQRIKVLLNELDKNKTIAEYCYVGLRGYIADRILSQNGFKILNVTGGYRASSILEFNPKKPSGKGEYMNEGMGSDVTIDPDTQAVKKY